MWATAWRQAMTSKIFRSTVFVAAIVLLSSLSIVMGVLYRHFSAVQVAQLKDELSLAATATEQYGNAFLENVEADRFRITWIDMDGTVLFDTQSDVSAMENHADREEVQEARQHGYGDGIRRSNTLTARTFYEAQRLKDGTILRVSTTQASVGALVLGMLQPILVIVVIAIAVSAVLANKMARTITEPLNRLDLEHPMQNKTYDEVSPLLQRINQQHLQISLQMQELKQKSEELDQIVSNMQEGLVLLSNPTAQQLFGVDETYIGKSIFSLPSSEELRSAVNAALDHSHGRARIKRNDRDYQLDLSRTESDGRILGAVLLAFDITDSLHAEQTRR